MVYEYLPKIPKVNKDGFVDLSCTNSFTPLNKPIIDTAESMIKMKFPSELRQFYEEVGYGNLTAPMNPPDNYSFSNTNMILHPLVVARFRKGQLLNDDMQAYMATDTFEMLEPGDLPVFEIGDSSSFMIMKPKSDNPNAVWYMGMEKIEDSFERFIWRLYHEDPAYYSADWAKDYL